MATLSPLTEFALLVRAPDDTLDLERLVVCIARMGNPGLLASDVATTLDTLAERVADNAPPSLPPDRLAAALARVIGGTLGFVGDRASFGAAEGSYLDQVLARRTGLPILMAVVWVLLGRRIGVPIAGIGYPGHFLACIDLPGARIYVDPFAGGTPCEAEDLLLRLPPGLDRAVLDPAPVRAIVTRMLGNLKNLWVAQQDLERALGAVDRLLLTVGEVPHEIRDRGLLAHRLGRSAESARDLKRYLALAPNAPDAAEVARLLGTPTRS
jgi:regulator of sirC expression with transglutaminase-like and TPR domain